MWRRWLGRNIFIFTLLCSSTSSSAACRGQHHLQPQPKVSMTQLRVTEFPAETTAVVPQLMVNTCYDAPCALHQYIRTVTIQRLGSAVASCPNITTCTSAVCWYIRPEHRQLSDPRWSHCTVAEHEQHPQLQSTSSIYSCRVQAASTAAENQNQSASVPSQVQYMHWMCTFILSLKVKSALICCAGRSARG